MTPRLSDDASLQAFAFLACAAELANAALELGGRENEADVELFNAALDAVRDVADASDGEPTDEAMAQELRRLAWTQIELARAVLYAGAVR